MGNDQTPGYVGVMAPTLTVSLLVLLLMILAVITIINCNGWIMTKGLGYSMFVLYVLFVVYDLTRNYRWLCPCDNANACDCNMLLKGWPLFRGKNVTARFGYQKKK